MTPATMAAGHLRSRCRIPVRKTKPVPPIRHPGSCHRPAALDRPAMRRPSGVIACGPMPAARQIAGSVVPRLTWLERNGPGNDGQFRGLWVVAGFPGPTNPGPRNVGSGLQLKIAFRRFNSRLHSGCTSERPQPLGTQLRSYGAIPDSAGSSQGPTLV